MKGLEVDPRVAASEAPGSPVPSGLSAVAVAMWNRNIIMLKRYAFNTLTQLINVYVLFLVVFFARAASPASWAARPSPWETRWTRPSSAFSCGFWRCPVIPNWPTAS